MPGVVTFPYLINTLNPLRLNFFYNFFVMGKIFQKLVSEVTSNSSIYVTVGQGHFFSHVFVIFFP